MKTIKVVAVEKRAVETYKENLKIFFEKHAVIEGICLREQSIKEKVDADIIVVSNPAIFSYISDIVSNDCHIIYIDIAFYRKDIEKLTHISKGTDVLLVDYKEYMAISTVALLNEYGINHINMIPYSPDMYLKNVNNCSIAITPGLTDLVPKEIKEVINIGYRKIDINTITTIASLLGISGYEFNRKIIEYSAALYNKSDVLVTTLKSINKNQVHIDAILDSIDDGIIIHDHSKNILHCSKHLCRLMNIEPPTQGPCNQEANMLCKELLSMDETENKFIKDNEHNITMVVTKRLLNHSDENNYIIIIKDAESIHNIEIDLRRNLINKGYIAKYSFNDIVYYGNAMQKTIEIAKKVASLNVTTLLYGETGTGKELMAHAIHNNSSRRNYPFLAINCAALSENLLESELFGYEEGSFTGAKKGGKKGLFELAHNGTLFLDEVSCVSTSMQMKLLRVLQEREIMRIGGTNLIPINVRIIASTNEDLNELIKNGTFRRDLYYRINNFTITIPPLRERSEDIPYIINSIMASHKCKKYIDQNLMNFLMQYDWPGNIRELKNCIEYLIYMGGDYLTIKDLPSTIMVNQNGNEYDNLLSDEIKIIKSIINICSNNPVGRDRLYSLLQHKGYEITEYKLRKLLDYLKSKNIISYGKGRTGIKVIN